MPTLAEQARQVAQKYYPIGCEDFHSLLDDVLASLTAAREQCAVTADWLAEVHSKAYRKADLAGNEDAMCFIAGLRDGAKGVAMEIRKGGGL